MGNTCCIKISDFPMKCEEMRDQSLCDMPYIITRDDCITHVSPLALDVGVDLKMSVSLVKTIYPSIRILPYDQDLYCSIHRDFLDVYADCSPFVEPVREGEAFIDLIGVQDEVFEVRHIVDKVQAKSSMSGLYMVFCSSTSKLVSRIGANLATISTGFGRSKRLNRYIKDTDARFVFMTIRDEAKADFIERLPVQYLWCADRDDVNKLYRLGVRRIGDIRRIPVGILARQIGDSAYRINEMSYGIDSTPVYSCYPEMELSERRRFEEGVSDLESLVVAIYDMAGILVKRLSDTYMTTSNLSLKITAIGARGEIVVSRDKKLKHPTASLRYIKSNLMQMISAISADLHPDSSNTGPGGLGSPEDDFGCAGSLGLRAIGEVCIKFGDIKPLDAGKIDLFDDIGEKEREQLLERVILNIEGRFGADRIELAGALASSRHDRLRAILDVF